MKLIIQIPCYNEAEALPSTIGALPDSVSGFKNIKILVIDDGSTDGTAEVAEKAGAHHIVGMPHHNGLAIAFVSELEACLKYGADVIVNTDADNQYVADGINNLVQPILANKADMVIGARDIASLSTFSSTKRFLQRFGSWIITQASGVRSPDATSGF